MKKREYSAVMVFLCIMLVISLLALALIIIIRSANSGPSENVPSADEEIYPTENIVQDFDAATGGEADNPGIWSVVNSMSLHEKICQMFIVLPDALTGVKNTTLAGEKIKNGLFQYPVGGLVFLADNIESGEQLTEFIKNVSSYSKMGLFITCDEEGGRASRLKYSLGAHDVGPMLEYKDEGREKAYENARIISGALKKYGFNMDLAPDADVLTNEENTVIGDRAYSDNYEQAALLVSAAVEGFQSENIITVIKHFPGHGSTTEDSHEGPAYVNKSLDELRKQDFLPFYSGIASGADMVMLGHLMTSSIDSELPATLSYKTVTGVLRNELGYKGLVITDALNMKALTGQYSDEEIAIGAVKAGVDILLSPDNLEASVAAIKNAVEQGEISEESISQSVYRILEVKANRKIIDIPESRDSFAAASASAAPSSDASQRADGLPDIDINQWPYRLVNAENPLEGDFKPEVSLIANGQYFDARAAEALSAMYAAAKESGLSIILNSGYRNIDTQRRLYDNRLNMQLASGMSEEEAKKTTLQIVAYPGMSEHNLGLAIDILDKEYNISPVTTAFADTELGGWLKENCANFGFILRYPENKTDITGISFEPWHFRYVGRNAAKYIMENDLCLEEFLSLYKG